MYKFEKEFVQLLNEGNLNYRECFQKILIQKVNLELFKQGEKSTKRKNPYTNLTDFGAFVKDIQSLTWIIEFYDSNEKLLHKIEANEQNNFEAGFSVVWYSLSDLEQKLANKNEIRIIKIFAQIPICVDLKTGKISFNKKLNSSLNLNWKRTLLQEIREFNFEDFENNKKNLVRINAVLDDRVTPVKICQVNGSFLFAFWQNSDNVKKRYQKNN